MIDWLDGLAASVGWAGVAGARPLYVRVSRRRRPLQGREAVRQILGKHSESLGRRFNHFSVTTSEEPSN